mmetsp:Transcript_20095/g.27710  ORF Transcript_20095/g.27710 Transcript_20095/m.27710 type:complete len:241 (+) Transcript_20095:58-780(+)|eukprot:CAMPEP_0201476538 /NCGR_PEP_ID=MMETSP0151_2-20130828/1730_1 /ASSEMBLY_ACC=CAM_ASM_000257 /TAXON_ID=200890 /ORGANISM="Paramoeba atlantica, Strain 621/1 / CCAP 1560/9" /LENGTH=240 /DNA_ID=CAMNT_0047856939 /DNA_START=43 /DNA_END=765 /DNA_ORIENTATION=-
MGSAMSYAFGKVVKETYQEKKVQIAVIGDRYSEKTDILLCGKLGDVTPSLDYKQKKNLVSQGKIVADEEYGSDEMVAKVFHVGGRSNYGMKSSWQKAIGECDAVIFHMSDSGYFYPEDVQGIDLQNKPVLVDLGYVVDDEQTVESIRSRFPTKITEDLFRVVFHTGNVVEMHSKIYKEAFEWLTTTIAVKNAEKWAKEDAKEVQKSQEKEKEKMKKKFLSKQKKKSSSSQKASTPVVLAA